MGLFWRQPKRGRKNGAQSCRTSLGNPVLLSSRAPMEDGCQRKRDTWPKPKLVEIFPSPTKSGGSVVFATCSAAKSFAVFFIESRTCVICNGGTPRTGKSLAIPATSQLGEQKVFGVFGDSVTVCFHF